MSDTLQARFLASGSSGNCTMVSCGPNYILVDAGIPYKMIWKRYLKDFPEMRCRGILVSHHHSDHSKCALSIADRLNVPIAVSEECAEEWKQLKARRGTDRYVPSVRLVPGVPVPFADGIVVEGVEVPHSKGSIGFLIRGNNGQALSIFTDIASITAEMQAAMEESTTIAIEADHSWGMLWAYDGYDYNLKERIGKTHMCNTVLATFFDRFHGPALKRIVLIHLSPRTNRPELAREVVKNSVSDEVEVLVAPADEALGPLEV